MMLNFFLLLPLILVNFCSHNVNAQFHDIALGGGRSAVWACASRTTTIDKQSAVDCFLPNDAYSNDGIYTSRGSLRGDYNNSVVSVGGSSSGSTFWACASEEGGDVGCFQPSDSYTDEALSLRATLLSSTGGGEPYINLDVGGAGSSTIWACAINAVGLGCFMPNDAYSNDGVYELRATLSGEFSQIAVEGGGSTIWACVILSTDGSVGCFLPNDAYTNDGVYQFRATLSARSYSQISIGAGSGSTIWACGINSDSLGVDCFLPNDAYSNDGVYQVRASLVGEYSQISLGGGGSSTIWACAIHATHGIDCFLPNEAYSNDGVYQIRANLAGKYSHISLGNGASSTIWACAIQAGGEAVDCFQPNDAYSNDGVYKIRATYSLPTPAPTISPTTSRAPSSSPSVSPTLVPTISSEPSAVPMDNEHDNISGNIPSLHLHFLASCAATVVFLVCVF